MSGTAGPRPRVVFASPRKLPRAADLPGRVVVLDIAFAAEGLGKGFARTTGRFIEALGDRLARWVDHHDHPLHAQFTQDPRFVLCSKADHGACPEMITPELVADTGPVETIVSHFDLDGLFAAAKWILGGREPYPGADDDARAADTRMGTLSARGLAVDQALRARWNDELLKQRIVNYLVGGLREDGPEAADIADAAAEHRAQAERARDMARGFEVEGGVAVLRVPGGAEPFDKTELLLEGQRLAPVSVVLDRGNATIAAAFDSGLDFVELLDLGGGMPTRVNIPAKHLPRALETIRARLSAG